MKSEGNYEEHPVFQTVETKLAKEEFHQGFISLLYTTMILYLR